MWNTDGFKTDNRAETEIHIKLGHHISGRSPNTIQAQFHATEVYLCEGLGTSEILGIGLADKTKVNYFLLTRYVFKFLSHSNIFKQCKFKERLK